MATVSIDITRAMAIDGYMTEPELVWLAEQAVEHSVIVEIGSYLGRSTRAMLDHTEGVVYAVDDWKGPRDVYMSKEVRQMLMECFQENTREHMGKKLIPLVANHGSLIVINDEIDMVFIDGSHEYLDVKRDIEIWKPKLVKGGLLCGHDAGVFDGVNRAVSELLGDVDVADNTSIWWVTV